VSHSGPVKKSSLNNRVRSGANAGRSVHRAHEPRVGVRRSPRTQTHITSHSDAPTDMHIDRTRTDDDDDDGTEADQVMRADRMDVNTAWTDEHAGTEAGQMMSAAGMETDDDADDDTDVVDTRLDTESAHVLKSSSSTLPVTTDGDDSDGEEGDVVDVVENELEDAESLSRHCATGDLLREDRLADSVLCATVSDDESVSSSEADSVDVVDETHTDSDTVSVSPADSQLQLPVQSASAASDLVIQQQQQQLNEDCEPDKGTASISSELTEQSVATALSDYQHHHHHHQHQQQHQQWRGRSQRECTELTGESLATGLTTVTDVRRGAMWRDSLFPSDLPPKPTTDKLMTVGKPNVTRASLEKPDVIRGEKMAVSLGQEMLSLDWQSSPQQQLSGNTVLVSGEKQCVSARRASGTEPCQYQRAGSHLVGASYYTATGDQMSCTQPHTAVPLAVMYAEHDRPSSSSTVRPPPAAAAASVDNESRLTHMWTEPAARRGPLPAHQHHHHHQQPQTPQHHHVPAVSSTLQHSVTHNPASRVTSSHHPVVTAAPQFVRTSDQHQHQQKSHHHKHGLSSSSSASHHHQSSSVTDEHTASLAAAAARHYDMFSACRIQQPALSYFPAAAHQGAAAAAAAAALPMGVVGLHHAQMAVAAAANFAAPAAAAAMSGQQAANSAMYSAAAAAAYSYLNGGALQPFNVDINTVMRR